MRIIRMDVSHGKPHLEPTIGLDMARSLCIIAMVEPSRGSPVERHNIAMDRQVGDRQPSGPPRPCHGLRVLDFARGPVAMTAMVLADYGADVVRVEEGRDNAFDRMPAYRPWNRGKSALGAALR